MDHTVECQSRAQGRGTQGSSQPLRGYRIRSGPRKDRSRQHGGL